jgi:hypothetical protein
MDMMAENPLEAAETLAELFAHDNEVKIFSILLLLNFNDDMYSVLPKCVSRFL